MLVSSRSPFAVRRSPHARRFADVTNPLAWHFAPDQINFHELYDVSSDYYMLDNIYWHAGEAVKAQLHAQLQAAIKCKGATECFSVLA